MIGRLLLLVMLCFSLQLAYASPQTTLNDVENFSLSLSKSLDTTQNIRPHEHIVKSISDNRRLITFEDGMSFTLKWWYNPLKLKGVPKAWKPGDRIYITLLKDGYCKLRHSLLKDTMLSLINSFPYPNLTIKSFPHAEDTDAYSKIFLSDGALYRSIDDHAFHYLNWQVNDKIFVFANSNEEFQLWNIDKKNILYAKFVTHSIPADLDVIKVKDILGMEARLNQKVLQQPQATKSVVTSLLNYVAGLKNGKRPIGVFLFLGPTGVGKTELAKVLTQEIYKDSKKMVRFDMSHFSEPNAITKLIGSPPGYVNHEEGGQLTNALLRDPQIVALFDEVDKAHLQVMHAFLSVFDEGVMSDNKNNQINCSDTIFIMTSNFCGEEIAKLYNLGYSDDDILSFIEPALMDAISPELYNRVQTVLFRPLAQETMKALVEIFLDQVQNKVWADKGVSLTIDESLVNFLTEHGYHPLLGARPLKKLIEKRVLSALAYHIIADGVKEGDSLNLLYDKDEDLVVVSYQTTENN